jgi:hypothetical protein
MTTYCAAATSTLSFQRKLDSSAFIFGAQHRHSALRAGYHLGSSLRWNDGWVMKPRRALAG